MLNFDYGVFFVMHNFLEKRALSIATTYAIKRLPPCSITRVEFLANAARVHWEWKSEHSGKDTGYIDIPESVLIDDNGWQRLDEIHSSR